MEDIVIIGAGGVGRETAMLVEQINEVKPVWNLLGFLDDNSKLHGSYINGYKVLGGIDHISEFENTYVVCAIASSPVKMRICEGLRKNRVRFATLIHPSVSITKTTSMGVDVIIYPRVTITTNVRIGDHVILSPGCGIGHESIVEDYCSILWNTNISGNVRIESGCLLGSGCTVIQNITIGRDCIIGAGTVVLKDLPERCTAVGVPARVIKYADEMISSF